MLGRATEVLAATGSRGSAREQSELYDAIPRRHTNRNPYRLTSLPEDFVEEIRQIANGEADCQNVRVTAAENRNHIVDLMSKACDIVFTDPLMVGGSDRFVRHEWSDVQKLRDGLITDEDGQAPLTAAMRKLAPLSWRRSAFMQRIWPGND